MSWASSVVLKFRGAEKWPEIEARVYSCTWEYISGDAGPEGQTTLVFTYRIHGELYTGKAIWGDPEGLDTWKRDDTVIVRYDPKHPSRSWFPERQELDIPFLFVFFMICAGVVFLIFQALLTGHAL